MSDTAWVVLNLPSPPSANRWWRNVKGRMVLSKAARLYKQAIPLLARKQAMIPAPIPIRIGIRWYRDRKSGDLDKRLGVILDALQGVCYQNDSQIVEIHAIRDDSKFQKGIVVKVARAVESP